jgi:hypothetical protein
MSHDDFDGRGTPREERGVLGNVVELDAQWHVLRKTTNPVEVGLTLKPCMPSAGAVFFVHRISPLLIGPNASIRVPGRKDAKTI